MSGNAPLGSELYLELVKDLIELTNAAKIEWQFPDEPTTAFEYEVNVGSYNIDIKSADGDGQLPFILRVFEDQFRLVVEIDSRIERDWNARLAELYDAVVRQVTRVDIKLQPLLSELRQLKGQ
jgi:hypothetical protein